jgi:hypothetical protein
MTESASETIFEDRAVAVSRSALESLHAYLQSVVAANVKNKEAYDKEEHFGVSYTVNLFDGGKRSLSFEELLAYGNRGQRRISALTIETRPVHVSNRVSIDIGDTHLTVRVHIRGAELEIIKIREHCEDFVHAVNSPFAWLYTRLGWWVAFASALTLWVLGQQVVTTSDLVVSKRTILGGILVASAFAFPWIVEPLRNRFFPKVIFALGNEFPKFESAKGIHTWMIRGVIAAAVTAAVGALFAVVRASSG